MRNDELSRKEKGIVIAIIAGIFLFASLFTIVTEKSAFKKMEEIRADCKLEGGNYEFNVEVYEFGPCNVDSWNRTCQVEIKTELSMACVIGTRAFQIYGGDLGWLGQLPYQRHKMHEVIP